MDVQTLVQLGLSRPQAKAYIYLVKDGSLAPPALAKKITESRSNTYKILDRLVELGLARKTEEHKKFIYRPENPIALEKLTKQARDTALAREKQIRESMPALLSYFYTYSEQPGVRMFQGKDNLKEVFNDMLRTGQDIYLIRSPDDAKFYDETFFERFRTKRAALGITTYALTVDVPSAIHDTERDKRNNFVRIWLPPETYTAPVEYNIYGDKVAIISYGQEAIATIIESPQIADSFRQLFALIRMSNQDRAS
jgi:sugar-specific transcriptional regulator TrmB